MPNTHRDYWTEIVSQSFDEHKVVATAEQIAAVAKDIEVSHENYGLAFPQPCGRDEVSRELADLRGKLFKEESKMRCGECLGRGLSMNEKTGAYYQQWPCPRCKGKGRVYP